MDLMALKERIFDVLDFRGNVEVEFTQHPGLRVTCRDGKATVGADSLSGYCRGLTELALELSEGKEQVLLEKKPQFRWCGTMLDMSRGSAMQVPAIKKYLDLMACFGMNMLMLYTEDMFPLEGYPFFGHKRGRYSLAELQELDAYAWELGIEMIPCVQTLGHLERYLSWPEAAPMRDTPFNLLPGTKESMALIEEILKFMKKAFRSRHIHLGMDEVTNLGTGAHFHQHKGQAVDQQALLFDHLKKVCGLCEKYDYDPIIWSDLFFPNPKGDQIYTYDSYFPENYRDQLPKNLRLMYWYYSSRNVNRYCTMLRRHLQTGNPIAFAGAGWNWCGFAPDHHLTFSFMEPALEACLEVNPEMVINTLWSDGAETPFFLTFPSNALFAQYQWDGTSANADGAWRMNAFVTKTPKWIYEEMNKLDYGLADNVCLGRRLLRTDVLETVGVQNCFLPENWPDVFTDSQPMQTYRQAAEALDKFAAEHPAWQDCICLEAEALRTAAYKAELHVRLGSAYRAKDKKELRRLLTQVLPGCLESYRKLYAILGVIRRREMKAFGWEQHSKEYGFQIARLEYAIQVLSAYLDGALSQIEELEVIPLHCHARVWDHTSDD